MKHRHSSPLPFLLLTLIMLLPSVARLASASEWHAYSYTDTYLRACRMGGHLFILKGSHLFRADIDTWEVEQEVNRESGLSATDILDICYSETLDRLAIVYTSGLIDVLYPDGTVWTIPDYYNAPMAGLDKTICSAREQEGLLFVCTAQGFFVVDLEQDAILQNFNLGFKVNTAWAFDDAWYYSTSYGVFYCPYSSNPHAPGAWQKAADAPIYTAHVFRRADLEQCWLLAYDQSIRGIEPGTHALYRSTAANTVTRLDRAGGYLLASSADSLVLYNAYFGRPPHIESPVLSGVRLASLQNGNYLDVTSVCVLADDGHQMALLRPNLGIEADTIEQVGTHTFSPVPLREQYLQVVNHQQSGQINHLCLSANGEVGMSYVPPINTGYSAMLRLQGFLTTYKPAIDHWDNYDATCVTSYLTSGNRRFIAIDGMAADPLYASRYWFSTLEDGIVGINQGRFMVRYNTTTTNGGLSECAPGSCRVGGITVSPSGDIWCVNEGTTNQLRVRQRSTQTWRSFLIPGLEKTYGYTHLLHTRCDNRHQLWGYQQHTYQSTNLFAYDYAGTLTDTSDDRVTSFKTLIPIIEANGQTTQNTPLSQLKTDIPFTPYYGRNIHEGPDGAIWVLNTSGLFVIDHPDSVFVYPGLVRPVMTNVIPTSMANDNNGRLWVGTESDGLYLLSTDGREELAHLTSSNSLLSTDEILSLCYDSLHSTLWIATAGQILSHTYEADEYGNKGTWVTPAYCYPQTMTYASRQTVNVFGLKDDTALTVSNSQGRVVASATPYAGIGTIDATALPIGTYTITGTDSDGHRGALLTFTITK